MLRFEIGSMKKGKKKLNEYIRKKKIQIENKINNEIYIYIYIMITNLIITPLILIIEIGSSNLAGHLYELYMHKLIYIISIKMLLVKC